MKFFLYFIILLILFGCDKKDEPIKECKQPLLEVKINVSKPQTDFDLSLTNADDVTLVMYLVKDDKGNTVKEQSSSGKPNFSITVSVPISGNYSFSAKATTDCGVKDVAPQILSGQTCNAPTKITLKENAAQVIVASWANGITGDIQGVVNWTIAPADGSKISDNSGATFNNLKLGVIYTIVAKFKDKCNIDKTLSEQLTTLVPVNDYANYDFYVAENGCGIVDLFTKNFQKVSGLNGYLSFNVIGNNLYTFGSKEYRKLVPKDYYAPSDNYGGVVYKNGVELYDDIGGYAGNVFSVQESAGNLYCLTGYQAHEPVSSSSYTTFRTVPKIYKNGVLLDSLQGPFSNTVNINNKIITNKGFAVKVSDLVIKGSDIYVLGLCSDFKTGNVSIGYWKNGIYTQLKLVPDPIKYNLKMLISPNGDIYYHCFTAGFTAPKVNTFLFKNSTEMLNGKFDDITIQDFGVDNDNNVYILGKYYDNGYRLGIYKNGLLEYSAAIDVESNQFRLNVEDGKVFVCAATLNGDYKMNVYEYKSSTKVLSKINNTASNYITGNLICSSIRMPGFQVKKK